MIHLKETDIKKTEMTTLVIPVCEDERIHTNRTLTTLLKLTEQAEEFQGKKDETVTFYNPKSLKTERVIFIGLGKAAQVTADSLRALGGKAVRSCIKKRLESLFIAVPAAKQLPLKIEEIVTPMLEGACLGNHVFDRYKEEKKEHPLKEITLCVNKQTAEKYAALPEQISKICAGTLMARDWVSTPANDKRPEQYAAEIVKEAEKSGLSVTVLDEKELAKKKFGAMLAVAQGSDARPRLVILEHKAEKSDRTIALVGKGVTFDTGGLNLKISGGMTGMKMDMGGSAAVAGAMLAVAALKPDVNVVGLMPIVENMPSGKAIRPGDIITSYSGKTVEIGNTDAEGRLILIDAMAYAVKTYKPDTMLDFATLTGACIVALGEKIAGVFTKDEELAETILASGRQTGERCWKMPLPDDYLEMMKSDFADINNMSSSKWGGAITAALFLSEFVGETRWAHIDIAGPAYVKKGNAYCGPGGTGFGVRLICDMLEKL